MPQVWPMLPVPGLHKENAYGNGVDFIKPTSKDAAMLHCPQCRFDRPMVPSHLPNWRCTSGCARSDIMACEKGAISIGTSCPFAFASQSIHPNSFKKKK